MMLMYLVTTNKNLNSFVPIPKLISLQFTLTGILHRCLHTSTSIHRIYKLVNQNSSSPRVLVGIVEDLSWLSQQ